ncbi:2-succinyl-5-enolpyruvyl-6-hydroxy-3-cyclohexene-1-carboxylate synthase [Vibrio sp. 10N.222.52.B12]|uniref:thiamine pyrophosphate-binding protein n=1 Tax=Vibrio TaxID=662 RepID=UPI00039D1085|nr:MULTISPECIES: thiamine pyrophosphate-binding protein [Vibrio]PMO41095.1 2-succinyl-5-enolpyruvyl-6-hydroxy-3-cyclohexene-1-carboxylate synthase [Vibrio sp. 10N.222.52.B12]
MFTREKNAQIVMSLLKQHGIKKVVASPGNTNVAFIGSIQNDPYFEMYSAVDERSAAYMACGLAAESEEPVVISCTGATASRNYLPGLTEAYYRKLPVLAITSTQDTSKVGHLVAQVIDRSSLQNDVTKVSVSMPIVKDADDVWACEVSANKAILELYRDGGGPAHINLFTNYNLPFDCKVLPTSRAIHRHFIDSGNLPELKGKVAVFIGSHPKWEQKQTEALDAFCEANDAVVFCDHTSGYKGKYRLLFSLAAGQEYMDNSALRPDISIHIGEISGDYPSLRMSGKQVWRVSRDGELRDTFRKLKHVFEMPESLFFKKYTQSNSPNNSYYLTCKDYLSSLRESMPELPYSNIWVASQLATHLPPHSNLHLGILNSLRSWNFFEVPETVDVCSNVGGFGIDGILSSLLGASLNNESKPYFCVLGDLAFFYDMNTLGNRHVGKNLRILMINNGKGTEFKQYNHHAAYFDDAADEYIAAANHFGNKSKTLVKNFAQDLGLQYLSASTKEEFIKAKEQFLSVEPMKQSVVFEVFTDSRLESKALEKVLNIKQDSKLLLKGKTKKMIGHKGMSTIRKIVKGS